MGLEYGIEISKTLVEMIVAMELISRARILVWLSYSGTCDNTLAREGWAPCITLPALCMLVVQRIQPLMSAPILRAESETLPHPLHCHAPPQCKDTQVSWSLGN